MEQYDIYNIISISFNLTNINYSLILVVFIILFINLNDNKKIIASWWGILNESLYRTLLFMIENYINSKLIIYLPLIYTIFTIILFSNFIGMIPYSSTPSVEIILTLT